MENSQSQGFPRDNNLSLHWNKLSSDYLRIAKFDPYSRQYIEENRIPKANQESVLPNHRNVSTVFIRYKVALTKLISLSLEDERASLVTFFTTKPPRISVVAITESSRHWSSISIHGIPRASCLVSAACCSRSTWLHQSLALSPVRK